MKKFVTILVVILLSGCQKQTTDFERSQIRINGHDFEILTANKMFQEYLSKSRNYLNDVFKPIEREFKDESEYSFLLESFNRKINPDKLLQDEIELLKATDFKQIVDSVFKIVTNELPSINTKILFFPANPEYREIFNTYGTGMHAITVGTGKIIFSVDPTFPNWQEQLPYALAHEYHHSIWTSRNFQTSRFTPLEYIILEGKAESFAMELFPNDSHPFINKISKDQEKAIWKLIQPEMNNKNSPINDKLFYGSKEIPVGSVYAIGYNIVESFEKCNPEISTMELLDMTPDQVLKLSRYIE